METESPSKKIRYSDKDLIDFCTFAGVDLDLIERWHESRFMVVQKILDLCEIEFGLPDGTIRRRTSKEEYVLARKAATYLLHKIIPDISNTEIAGIIDRNQSTVSIDLMYKIDPLMETDRSFRRKIHSIRNQLNQQPC